MDDKFKADVVDDVNLIVLPDLAAETDIKDLEMQIKTWLLSPVELHVFDFLNVSVLHESSYPVFSRLKQILKQNRKHVASLHMRPNILKDIKQAGMAEVFNPAASLIEAKTKAGLAGRRKIDVKLLEPFIKGTMTAMKVQCSLELRCEKPFLKQGQEMPFEIAGQISLNNSDLRCSVALCFTKDVFLKIYEAMVGEKHAEINQEVQDAAGELLNIVFGFAKTALLEKGIRLERAIPVILRGKELNIQQGEPGLTMILPFGSPAGRFHMEVAFD
jgi:chemotaxis protein CheX